MGNQDYNNYLRSKEWKEKRKVALDRAHHRCQLCNSPKFLEVHHRTYERFGDELPEDLTVLCQDCHRKFEKAKRQPKHYFNKRKVEPRKIDWKAVDLLYDEKKQILAEMSIAPYSRYKQLKKYLFDVNKEIKKLL